MSQEGYMTTFHTPGPVKLRVELHEGSIEVRSEQTDTTTVELEPEGNSADDLIRRATVEQRGNEIVVLVPRGRGGLFRHGCEILATIVVPLHSSATVEAASADVEMLGVLGDVVVSTSSGEVEVEHAANLRAKTASGDIEVGSVDGNCRANSGSADVTVGVVGGTCDVATGSGDVSIDTVGGRLAVKTGSGDVVVNSGSGDVDALAGSGDLELRRLVQGRVKAKTGSGDVAIGVSEGTAAYLDIMTVSGDVHSELDGASGPSDGDQTLEIHVMSGSGDVVLQRA
jgi:DUF4097 and DUF4098 domain-containing protein YvlB